MSARGSVQKCDASHWENLAVLDGCGSTELHENRNHPTVAENDPYWSSSPSGVSDS